MEFSKPNIKYKPLDIEIENISKIAGNLPESSPEIDDIDAITNKLMDHLALIQDYNNKIDSIDWLIDNAKKLSGNLKYTTSDPNILSAIETLGGDGDYVDLSLFEKAVDTVIDGYKQMALVSLTGAAN